MWNSHSLGRHEIILRPTRSDDAVIFLVLRLLPVALLVRCNQNLLSSILIKTVPTRAMCDLAVVSCMLAKA